MSVRRELVERLADYLGSSVNGLHHDQAVQVAEAFARLLLNVRRDVSEVETTTLGSAARQVQWHHLLAGDLAIVVDHGQYATPLHEGWTALP